VIDALLVCVAHDIAPVEPPEPYLGRRRREGGALGLARKNRPDLPPPKLNPLFGSEPVYHSVHHPNLAFSILPCVVDEARENDLLSANISMFYGQSRISADRARRPLRMATLDFGFPPQPADHHRQESARSRPWPHRQRPPAVDPKETGDGFYGWLLSSL
jgi:hypothetical protein